MREVACEYCGEIVTQFLMDVHHEESKEYPVLCPNHCGKKVTRDSVDAHLSIDCPLQMVACSYTEYGCEEMVERKRVDLHEREYLHSHFKLTCISTEKAHAEQTEKIQKLETENKQKDLEILIIESALLQMVPTGRIVWEIGQVRNKIESKVVSFSEEFNVGLYNCQGRINWEADVGHMGCYLCILKGDWDESLSWPFRYEIKITLLSSIPAFVWTRTVTQEKVQQFPQCFKKPENDRNVGFGTGAFKSHPHLINGVAARRDLVKLEIQVRRITPVN